ncbi:hypothetical protein GCM10023186_29160 [Hymenobacter koreensis]|uniref:TonB C-terminal domain-containing protein n=2 Tax=Hymenobacter koreensis TaxID=1084523 RepID=A0ABP8J6I3_9BACT
MLPLGLQAQFGTRSSAAIPLPYNPKYHVGDIAFDPTQDRADFALRPNRPIYQYYNFATSFTGGRLELRRLLHEALLPLPARGAASGYLTVRFVVNHRGETDRFRVSTLDSEYRPQPYEPALVADVLRACRSLKGWEPGLINGETQDSYYYITFVVDKGRIREATL